MRKLLGFLLVVLSSCTGGNQSITGVTAMDYFPSVLMIVGAVVSVIGILKYNKGYNDTDAKIIITIGGIIAIFGAIIYFF